MTLASSLSLNTLLGIAATLLGFSLLVQVLQELYKYLTSSKSRAYTEVLEDFLGPLWNRALQSGTVAALQVRGPTQWRRLRPAGVLLPLDRPALSSLLERTAPAWVQRCLAALRAEAELQKERPGVWSPAWQAFLGELSVAEKSSPGYWTSRDLIELLSTFGHRPGAPQGTKAGSGVPPATSDVSAAYLLTQCRRRLLGHVVDAEERFDQLQTNFDFAYRRRNLRQTFLISLAAAVAFNLPFDQIYRASSRMTTAEVAALAGEARALYDEVQKGAPSDESREAALRESLGQAERALRLATGKLAAWSEDEPRLDYVLNWGEVWDGESPSRWWNLARFVFGCLLTAVLASFGAPFWNDAAGALLRLNAGRVAPTAKDEG